MNSMPHQNMSHQQWLDQVVEETLEPELPICDPHHHLWDHRTGMQGAVGARYLLDEILEDVNSGHNIVSTIFIECGTMFSKDGPDEMKPINETLFVGGIAAMSASGTYGKTEIAKGIIGTAYLTLGDPVAEVLDAQIVAGAGRFKGIRQAASWDASPDVGNHRTEPKPGLYLDPVFREGFKHLATHDLTYEGWCYHHQIPELTDLARAFPDTRIILDHFGGPVGIGPYRGREEEVFAEWKKSVAELASCPNVYAKLGGLAMDVNGYDWHERPKPPSSEEFMQATRHYYEETIRLFGVERCMFESNFPVDKLSASYHTVWNSFKRLAADYSPDEKARLFHDTAVEVYRL